MAYWRLYYHIVFATKNRLPLMTPEIETQLHAYLAGKAAELGAIVHAVGGVADHAHMVASIPPKVAVATFVGRIKGASAHYLNHLPGREDTVFEWQRGYGVLSLGRKNLPGVVEYVRGQHEHHERGTVLHEIELVEGDEV
ncbi:MAG: IS200/IS605 family transposase [Chloroflexi bacterium]|nr:IS200/IS605 family transposase [Chloroflexota bacterium]